MSFQPVVSLPGLAGWNLLKRTKDTQLNLLQRAPDVANDLAYFQKRIGKVTSAQELVSDFRLMRVAVTAFGLEGDVQNRAFIRKVIEEGVSERSSLANRLSDKRYARLAAAFEHLARDTTAEKAPDLLAKVQAGFTTNIFESRVGEQSEDMRLALTLQRELPGIVRDFTTDNSRWFGILGNPPLRKAFQISLGLPDSIGKLDVDDQVSRMKSAAQRRFGTSDVAQLAEPDTLKRITDRFVIMAQIEAQQSSSSGAAIALMLLQNMRR
ncbi:MAG: DUF1217 domain-containing protein [Roseinatronobacter sp.]